WRCSPHSWRRTGMPRRSERRPSGDRLVGRARALEGMLSADDYDAGLAERYGWINRALPAAALGEVVRSLAHRVAGVPASGRAVLRDRINAIALAPADDFRRDSDLFAERARDPESQHRIRTAMARGFQTHDGEMTLGAMVGNLVGDQSGASTRRR